MLLNEKVTISERINQNQVDLVAQSVFSWHFKDAASVYDILSLSDKRFGIVQGYI